MGMPGTTITLMPHNMRHHMVATTFVCDLGKERGMEGEGYGRDGREGTLLGRQLTEQRAGTNAVRD